MNRKERGENRVEEMCKVETGGTGKMGQALIHNGHAHQIDYTNIPGTYFSLDSSFLSLSSPLSLSLTLSLSLILDR